MNDLMLNKNEVENSTLFKTQMILFMVDPKIMGPFSDIKLITVHKKKQCCNFLKKLYFRCSKCISFHFLFFRMI